MESEYEDYDDLVRNEGWQRFSQHVAALWGTVDGGGGSMFNQAVAQASADSSDADALAKLRQIIVAQKSVQQLMQFPARRVQELKPRDLQAVAYTGSRRGNL